MSSHETPHEPPYDERTGRHEPPEPPAMAAGAEQVRLPLEIGAEHPRDARQARAEGGEPIGFALTARARLLVAPDSLPALSVLPQVEASPDAASGAIEGEPRTVLDEPGDTRAARARALRRAGLAIEAIAAELGVDDLAVRVWCGDVAPARGRHLHGIASKARPAAACAVDEDAAMFAAMRERARDELIVRLADPASGFAAGLGLVAALADSSPHAVVVTTTSLRVAAAVVRWLLAETDADPLRLRVVLQHSAELAGDLAVHRWAAALGLPPERIVHTRLNGASAPDAVRATIRLADPVAAARVAGWCEALLAPSGPGAPDAVPGPGSSLR